MHYHFYVGVLVMLLWVGCSEKDKNVDWNLGEDLASNGDKVAKFFDKMVVYKLAYPIQSDPDWRREYESRKYPAFEAMSLIRQNGTQVFDSSDPTVIRGFCSALVLDAYANSRGALPPDARSGNGIEYRVVLTESGSGKVVYVLIFRPSGQDDWISYKLHYRGSTLFSRNLVRWIKERKF